MTESTATTPTEPRRLSREALSGWAAIVLGAAVVLGTMLVVYASVDFTLGLVFAAPIVTTLVAVGLCAMPRGWREELISIGVLSLCATLPVFMAAVAAQALRARSLQTLAMCVVVSGVAVGAVRFLARMRVPVAIAQALAVMLVVLWLASPIWAAKLLAGSSGETLMRLSDYHPLIALNGAYQPELGDWSHQPVAYQWLMNLGQDVPYLPPASVWKSAAAHLAVAIFLWLLALVPGRKRPPQLIG